MRSILLITALVAAASLAADRWPNADQPNADSLRWVRTADGWERSAHLIPAAPAGPRMHPFTLAALQILGAGVALTAGWKAPQGGRDELAPAMKSQRALRRARAPLGKRVGA